MQNSKSKELSLVSVDDLPEYPLDQNERLEAHSFMPWHFNRWLNSAFRLTASLEARGAAIDLFCISQNQTPVGTLPDDDRQLAALLNISADAWQRLSTASDSPMNSWQRCRCGGSVRLMHPVVTEVALEAFTRKKKNRDALAAGRERKRMNDLRATIEKVATKRMASDETVVLRVKAWLTENAPGNWTADYVTRALEAISMNGFA